MESFSDLMSSLDRTGRKKMKKYKSKSSAMLKVSAENCNESKSNVCVSKIIQEVPKRNNCYKETNLVGFFGHNSETLTKTSKKLESVVEMKYEASGVDQDSGERSIQHCLDHQSGASFPVTLHKKVIQADEMVSGIHQDKDRKRKKLDECLPASKKLNAVRIFSHQSENLISRGKKFEEVPLLLINEVQDNEKDLNCNDGECIKKQSSALNVRAISPVQVLPDEVTSFKTVDGVSRDFRCTICKKLPRKLNRSELYRHYAMNHFHAKLMNEYGHLKTCHLCKLDLKGSKTASHFGQKHNFVESFLPVEAWIPLSTYGASVIRRKLAGDGELPKQTLNRRETIPMIQEDFLMEELWVWPEIPVGFDLDGNKRVIGRNLTTSKQFCRIAKVGGFDIEHLKDECFIQEKLVKNSEMSSPSSSALEQLIQCRLCKKFEVNEKQLAVLHVHTAHVMKGSGDVLHDFEVLLRTGYLALQTDRNFSDVSALIEVTVCNVTVEESSTSSLLVDKAQSLELTDEEWELIIAVEKYQHRECVEAFDGCKPVVPEERDYVSDKFDEEWEDVCAAFEAKLEESGVTAVKTGSDEAVDKSEKEWELTCAAFKSTIAEVCVPTVTMERDEAAVMSDNEWEKVSAVENIKELQVTIPKRQSEYSSTSGYVSSFSDYSS